LRSHSDDSTANLLSNKGNFLALLEFSVRSGNTALGTHLKECGRNALYTSKTIKMILLNGQGKVLSEIKLAKWYLCSVMR